jgi:putative oxidoreductase
MGSLMGKGEHDFPALLLRTTIGPMLMAHGANKVFGKGGLEGTTRWFDSLGLKPGWAHARMAAATELGAGALLTVGAFNPLPEAAIVGLMASAAATDHRGKGFFIFKGGWEYVAIIGAAATALAGMGHGRYSIDHLLGRGRSGMRHGLLAAALGVGAAAALLAATYRPEPESPTPEETEETPGDAGTPPEAAESTAPESEASEPSLAE